MVITSMGQNSDNNDFQNHLCQCPESILNAVPRDCQKITFAELKLGENYENKAIIGKIYQLNPIGKRANGFIRKLVITDALSEDYENLRKLTVFLLDHYARDSDKAELEGYIIISNFLLEKSTFYKDNELPVQILVKTKECQVLFGRKHLTTEPESSNSHRSTKKKKNATEKALNKQAVHKKQKVVDDEESHLGGLVMETPCPVEQFLPPHPQGASSSQACHSEEKILANHYEYVPLETLQETEPKVAYNVYGIVEKCNLKVMQGKRTQILDLTLTDETHAGFNCSIFGNKDETFPDVYPGDIIRIHRMQVYKFRSQLKGRCLSPKFILVFSKSNNGSKPKTVAKSFTFVPDDSARVRKLFAWYNKKSEPKLISELNRGDYANIVCQIIGVYCAKKTEAVILKIWDGTKTNQLESTHWGLKDEILDEKLFIVAKNYYVILSVYGQHISTAAELRPGQFIEVRDAHLYSPLSNPDESKLCLHTGTKEGRGIEVLNDTDTRVIKLKERIEKIIIDVMECGNQTDDLLSQNNSIFLNCDISAYSSSQRSTRNNVDNATVEALNRPLSSKEDAIPPENTVLSVLEASVKPGQSTQEFGGTQREVEVMDIENDEMSAPTQQDPILNKTPLEYRMFLHNPSSQEKPSFPPFISETQAEWWKSIPSISETDHSEIIPSSLSEIVQHDVPYKFRVFCAVLSYKPNAKSLNEIIHLCCPECLYITKDAMPDFDPFEQRDGIFYFYCPECSTRKADKKYWPVLKYTFLLSFELHDGTGPSSLEAHLWGENAVKFFKDITPEQALKDAAASNSIFQMLWSICPNCRPFDATENRENNFSAYPVLNCCVLSYTTPGGTFYQIFDTRLL
ncbi:protection of telomeres protein 1 [Trichonephila inaurata madagascariensis]|uniref:Protection of telomeres protein 1 n=1 Tax=Trichonephila inaurata madagascariensis TaxID=2747483 RepID=A0A8X6JIK9_9ARAC|nr:protection of telomeres protein 1 [Trichonephila inaurata madagascariensis]